MGKDCHQMTINRFDYPLKWMLENPLSNQNNLFIVPNKVPSEEENSEDDGSTKTLESSKHKIEKRKE